MLDPHPQQLGKYRLGQLLATGGMGEVFLAKHEGPAGFAKTVVVKKILPHLARDQQFVDMFLNEARLAALLSHANIVQIFELGQQDDTYFIAMEYIHGRSLRAIKQRLLERQQLFSPILAARLCAHALQGLHYAHTLTDEQGVPLNVVHRDISPDNVLVSFNGQVKLVDFGIAKAANAVSTTRTGTIKGKYAYMAPEQLMGAGADGRIDVYATGVLLYELLTGSRPFQAPTEPALIAAILNNRPQPPRERNPALPEEIEAIILKALEKDPDRRFATAEGMSNALETWVTSTGQTLTVGNVGAFLRELFADELAQGTSTNGAKSISRSSGVVPKDAAVVAPAPVPVVQSERGTPSRERLRQPETAALRPTPPPEETATVTVPATGEISGVVASVAGGRRRLLAIGGVTGALLVCAGAALVMVRNAADSGIPAPRPISHRAAQSSLSAGTSERTTTTGSSPARAAGAASDAVATTSSAGSSPSGSVPGPALDAATVRSSNTALATAGSGAGSSVTGSAAAAAALGAAPDAVTTRTPTSASSPSGPARGFTVDAVTARGPTSALLAAGSGIGSTMTGSAAAAPALGAAPDAVATRTPTSASSPSRSAAARTSSTASPAAGFGAGSLMTGSAAAAPALGAAPDTVTTRTSTSASPGAASDAASVRTAMTHASAPASAAGVPSDAASHRASPSAAHGGVVARTLPDGSMSVDASRTGSPLRASSRRTAKPAPTVKEAGKVSFRVNPWAEVFLEGQSLGITPMPAVSVPAGRQTFTLKNPQIGVSRSVSVNVPPGGTAVVRADLFE
ncbi:MAG: protein kinase [Myxococcaceae bacterium]|nr:protein kinase [Myxococcaceae bacterium]